MKLHWSPNSPFVRKVMIALHEKQMLDQVECVRSKVVFTGEPNLSVLRDNPLGKIPTLVLADGRVLFDSHVICEFLDMVQPQPRLFAAEPDARLDDLRWEALTDGLLDALLLLRVEAQRGEGSDPVILASLARKAQASMAFLERDAEALASDAFAIRQIGTVCVLGYLDFRCGGSEWRQAFPALASWYAATVKRPSVEATAITEISVEKPLPLHFSGDSE